MTTPPEAPSNVATGQSSVGMQIGVVHGLTMYTLPEGATAAQTFEVGIGYLDGGMAQTARQYIDQARSDGLLTAKVWFYWLLALLRGRTARQLSPEDLTQLDVARERCQGIAGDEWADGVRIIFRLLDAQSAADADVRVIIKEFDDLGQRLRYNILRHLELFLKGSLEDQMWEREHARARDEQFSAGRNDRAWMFFQDTPVGPRVREPAEPELTTIQRTNTALATFVFVGAVCYLGWLLLSHGNIAGLLAFSASVFGGYFAATEGLVWRSDLAWLQAKDKEWRTPQRTATKPPRNGFADQVDSKFDRYFAKYLPHGADKDSWMSKTAGIRKHLRDEIVGIYRDSPPSADSVAWLIRYRVRQVSATWHRGDLTGYRDGLRTKPRTKAVCGIGLSFFVLGGCGTVALVVPLDPIRVIGILIIMTVFGFYAARKWLQIGLGKRRYAAEKEESGRRKAEAQVEFARWCEKLTDTPGDAQMAAWLDCDQKLLMGRAMRRYNLAASQVIAHAFIEAPADHYDKRARAKGGPWRYSQYRLMVFLLTADGIRQVEARLNFMKGSLHNLERTNFRFDAITSVKVSESDTKRRTLELALVNGQSIDVKVTEDSPGDLLPGEDAESLTRATVEATGLSNTLRVLEGIAAEGKEWIKREAGPRRTTTARSR